MILNLEHLPVKVLFPKHTPAIFNADNCLSPFAEEIMLVLTKMSTFLIHNDRREPSIIAAGYWLRKKQLLALKAQYSHARLSARGVAFHIAPGNVDTLFFYSMIISVLCGNQTILRISNKLSEETLYFIRLLEQFFLDKPEFSRVCSLMRIVQFEHQGNSGEVITQQLSLFADTRVIWGGNRAVDEISQVPLKSDANNITFPDRYSVAVIKLSHEKQIAGAVKSLISDIAPFNQQACSSPRVIYWLETAQNLQEEFWKILAHELAKQVTMNPNDLISRMVYLQRLPLLLPKEQRKQLFVTDYQMQKVIDLNMVPLEVILAHCGLWVLLNKQINCLTDITLFEHCQTMTVSGIEQNAIEDWRQQLNNSTIQLPKRIVPSGQALTFSHIWDGIDLIKNLTS